MNDNEINNLIGKRVKGIVTQLGEYINVPASMLGTKVRLEGSGEELTAYFDKQFRKKIISKTKEMEVEGVVEMGAYYPRVLIDKIVTPYLQIEKPVIAKKVAIEGPHNIFRDESGEEFVVGSNISPIELPLGFRAKIFPEGFDFTYNKAYLALRRNYTELDESIHKLASLDLCGLPHECYEQMIRQFALPDFKNKGKSFEVSNERGLNLRITGFHDNKFEISLGRVGIWGNKDSINDFLKFARTYIDYNANTRSYA